MKKRLWVSRDRLGYAIWTRKPSWDKGNMEFGGLGIWHGIDDECDCSYLSASQLKKVLSGNTIKLAMKELKRIELTITAEVKEL
jgi:hypothetical protein